MTVEAIWPQDTGVLRAEPYESYSTERANVTRVYQDTDINLVVWNLTPGQVTDAHKHPENAHTFIVLCGQGEYVRENDRPVPIHAGDFVIIPREVVHLIRNSGSEPLSYLAVSSIGPHGYSRA